MKSFRCFEIYEANLACKEEINHGRYFFLQRSAHDIRLPLPFVLRGRVHQEHHKSEKEKVVIS